MIVHPSTAPAGIGSTQEGRSASRHPIPDLRQPLPPARGPGYHRGTGGLPRGIVASPINSMSATSDSLTQVLGDEPRYFNRELSWLEFNARVLHLAEDPSLPLLERVKFLAIFARNLDEFFQVRVSGLQEQVGAGLGATTPDGIAPADQLKLIRERVVHQVGRASAVFTNDLADRLEKAQIRFVSWDELAATDREYLE